MRLFANKWNYTLGFLLFLLFSTQTFAADFVLKDVIEADERIANQRPMMLISPMTGEFIKFNNKWYEVRFFSFETKNSKYEPEGTLTFSKLINHAKLLYLGASPTTETLFPGYFFYAPRELKINGVNFLLSLRQVSNEKIVDKLEKDRAKKSNHLKQKEKQP